MSNSIDFYKGIIFHVISVRIIVPWYDHAFVWWIPVVDLNTYGDHELVTSRKQAHDHNQWTTRRLPQLRKISWAFTANPSYLKSFQWYSESEFIVRLNTIFSYTILILRSSLLNPLCNAQELRHHPHFQVVKRSHLKVCYSRVTSRVTCRVCHKRQNICIEFFKQSIIKKMVGSVGRIEIQTFICKKHIHWFCLFMVGKNIIQIANMCGSSSWTVLVQANSKMTMSQIWSVEMKPTRASYFIPYHLCQESFCISLCFLCGMIRGKTLHLCRWNHSKYATVWQWSHIAHWTLPDYHQGLLADVKNVAVLDKLFSSVFRTKEPL